MAQKYIIKNKRTNESLELTLEEFKSRFRMELQQAFNNFKNQEEQKEMLLPPFMHRNRDYKSDFYFDLRWNFNNHQTSLWYIDRII